MFFGGGGNPFEGMGGMGGMGRPRGPIDNKGLYETLGVGQKATASEIKKAYHRAARDHHPDRGGDKEKFQEIQ
jgi:DnaJ family protein A protein 2